MLAVLAGQVREQAHLAQLAAQQPMPVTCSRSWCTRQMVTSCSMQMVRGKSQLAGHDSPSSCFAGTHSCGVVWCVLQMVTSCLMQMVSQPAAGSVWVCSPQCINSSNSAQGMYSFSCFQA